MVDLPSSDGSTPLLTACYGGHVGMVRALLSAGARADLPNIKGRTPLDLLPHALRAEVERLVQQAKEEKGSARADESKAGAPSAPAAVLPPPAPLPVSISQPAAGIQRRWRWRLL